MFPYCLFILPFNVLDPFCPLGLSMMMDLSITVAAMWLWSAQKCGKCEEESEFSILFVFFNFLIKIFITHLQIPPLAQFSRFSYIYKVVQPLPQPNFITFLAPQKETLDTWTVFLHRCSPLPTSSNHQSTFRLSLSASSGHFLKWKRLAVWLSVTGFFHLA